jgi:hypothetical protein
MPTRHTISRAAQLYSGPAYYPRANAAPGIFMDLFNGRNYGVIAAAVATAAMASQAVTLNVPANLNGSLAASGVVTFDQARNVVAAWTTAAIITVHGTDIYGQPMTEQSASGTTFTGKKAFKTITAILFSASVTGATAGSGVAIGLPYREDVNGIVQALMDGAVTTYTFVVADTTFPATATTGDVHGTITFTTAPNGTHAYRVFLAIADRSGGTDLKTGAYGVDNFYSGT